MGVRFQLNELILNDGSFRSSRFDQFAGPERALGRLSQRFFMMG
jgi:hypothetical protein